MGTCYYLVNHRDRHVLDVGKADWLYGDDDGHAVSPFVVDAVLVRRLAASLGWHRGVQPDVVLAWLDEHGHGILVSEYDDHDPWRGGEIPGEFFTAAPGWTVVDGHTGKAWPAGPEREFALDHPRDSTLGRLLGRDWSWWSINRKSALVHVSGLWFVVEDRQLSATPESQALALASAMADALAAGQSGQSYFELVEPRLVGGEPSFVVRPVPQ